MRVDSAQSIGTIGKQNKMLREQQRRLPGMVEVEVAGVAVQQPVAPAHRQMCMCQWRIKKWKNQLGWNQNQPLQL
jgi:hypothetical protein